MINTVELIEKIFGNSKILEEFSSIEWKVEESNDKSILFYNFRNNTEKDLEIFYDRVKKKNFAICITNGNFQNQNEKIFCFKDEEVFEIKEYLLNLFYPIKKDLNFIGVTGTNGKTTTVDLIRQIAVQQNINVLTLGTLGIMHNESHVSEFGLTTPSYIDFRKFIFKHQEDISLVAMELSSIALEQKRTGNVKFKHIGWTNFTQDHLDAHLTMENYFKAKMLIFNSLTSEGKVSISSTQVELLSKIGEKENLESVNYDVDTSNPFFKLSYNKENLNVAMALVSSFIDLDKISFEKLSAPPGRANIIEYKNNFIVIDYAHTPDGIESVTRALKNSYPEKKLIILFGCGGDRDRTKRKLMSVAAEKFSDEVYLTTDNPRFEDPMQIISDACEGLTRKSEIIVDRKEAIEKAIGNLDNSVLLIAGKGHEPYMDVKGVKHPYNDTDWVKEIIGD